MAVTAGTAVAAAVTALRAPAVVTALLMVAAVMRAAIMTALGFLRDRVRPTAGAAVGRGDRHVDHPFDVAEEGAFLVIAERNRNAVGAGARGAADTVDIAFRDVR